MKSNMGWFGLIGHEQDLGIVRVPIPRQCLVPVKLAEAAAELDVLLARDVLVAEKQDAVLEERTVNLTERGFVHF